MPNDDETTATAHSAARSRQAGYAKALHELGQPASYTVQDGDSYKSIASAVGGDAEAIAAANAGVVSTDPNILEPGTVLTLPPPDAGGAQPAGEPRAEANDPDRATIAGGGRTAVTGPPARRPAARSRARKR